MVNSYPKIQSFCRDHGYDFQVVDMRWGIRDEATDDHSVLDLCLRELEQCQKLSTGPNFVVIYIFCYCLIHTFLGCSGLVIKASNHQ